MTKGSALIYFCSAKVAIAGAAEVAMTHPALKERQVVETNYSAVNLAAVVSVVVDSGSCRPEAAGHTRCPLP